MKIFLLLFSFIGLYLCIEKTESKFTKFDISQLYNDIKKDRANDIDWPFEKCRTDKQDGYKDGCPEGWECDKDKNNCLPISPIYWQFTVKSHKTVEIEDEGIKKKFLKVKLKAISPVETTGGEYFPILELENTVENKKNFEIGDKIKLYPKKETIRSNLGMGEQLKYFGYIVFNESKNYLTKTIYLG